MKKVYAVATIIGGVKFYYHNGENGLFGNYQPSFPPVRDLFESKVSAETFIKSNKDAMETKLSVVEAGDLDSDEIDKLNEQTHVVFKKDGDGDIVAFFMDTIDGETVQMYSHADGQCGSSMGYYNDCEPIESDELLPLLKELVKEVGMQHIKIESPYTSFTSLKYMRL